MMVRAQALPVRRGPHVRRRFLAVMYHYARDRSGPLAAIRGHSEASFAAQVDALASCLDPIDPASGPRDPDRPGVLLTFDDGLSDHVEVVAPILEGRGLRGVFFLSGAPFVEGRMLSAHLLHLLLCHVEASELADRVRQRLGAIDPVSDWEERVDAKEAAALYHYESPPLARMKYLLHVTLPPSLRRRILEELFAECVGAQRDWVPRWYGTVDQWRDLQARGHVIGGHGYWHEPLGRMAADEAADDIRRCMKFLREAFGERPRPFSYPFGSLNDAVAAACRQAGFVAAYTTSHGWNHAGTRPYRLHRIDTIRVETTLAPGRTA